MNDMDKKSEAEKLRLKAEEVLKTPTHTVSGLSLSLSETDPVKLNHELQVYQVELEMQNEELRRTLVAGQIAIEKYTELYEFAPTGYLSLSEEGRIVEVNFSASHLLGKERLRLKNSMFGFFVSDDTKPVFNLFFEKVFTTKLKATCELALTIDGNPPVYVQLTGRINENENQCLISIVDITARRQMENELKLSEIKFRTLFESANDAIFMMNEKVFLDCNTKAHILFGCGQNEIIGHSPAEFSPLLQPDGELSSEKTAEKIHGALAGNPQIFYWKHHQYDGTPFDAEVSLNKVEISGQSCLQAIVRDVSDKIQSLKTLQDSEEKYRLLADHMTDIVWLMNMDFKVTYKSPSSEKLRGFTSQEIKDLPMEKNLTPESLKVALEMFYREIPKVEANPDYNPQNTVELEYYRKDGTTIWLENRFSILRNGDGKPISILGEGRDITARRQTEKELKDSESHARALIDAIPDLMFRLSSQGVFLDYKAAKEDLAYQTQSIIGKNIREMFLPAFADMVDEKIAQTLITGQMHIFEYQLSLPSIGFREFEARMVPSGPDEVITIVRDVTERKKAEAEIILKNGQLIQANLEKDKFFSIVAHDLRSPFNSFLGFTKMFVDELDTFSIKDLQKIALSMRNSASNLFALLENLLEWSRLRRGVTDFKPETFLLKDFGEESIISVMEPANKKGIEIRYEIAENIEVYADRYMLASVIRNLVSNATKFTHQRGIITFAAKLESDCSIEISISDTGIGMNMNMIENLFRLDEQTNRKGTDDEPSTGLGLIICKEFIEKHGGRLWVESEEGKGSTFYFSLPAHANDK